MKIDLEDLPRLKDVFYSLLGGRHLSSDDFDLYHDLQEHEVEYEQLFDALGYRLHADRRGFYYLLGDSEPAMNQTTRKMALIMFVLVELMADEGRDPVSVVRQDAMDVGAIAGRLWQKEQQMFVDGGLPSVDAIEKCLVNSFCSLGFARTEGSMIRFSPPIERFLDLCMEFGRRDDGNESEHCTEDDAILNADENPLETTDDV